MTKSEETEIPWGSLALAEEEGLEVLKTSYGRDSTDPAPFGHRFTIASDGTVCALVAGDMGYESTHIVIPRQDILALISDWPEVSLVKTSTLDIDDPPEMPESNPHIEAEGVGLEGRLKAAIAAMSQARLAFAGMVSAHSAINQLDEVLENEHDLKTQDTPNPGM